MSSRHTVKVNRFRFRFRRRSSWSCQLYTLVPRCSPLPDRCCLYTERRLAIHSNSVMHVKSRLLRLACLMPSALPAAALPFALSLKSLSLFRPCTPCRSVAAHQLPSCATHAAPCKAAMCRRCLGYSRCSDNTVTHVTLNRAASARRCCGQAMNRVVPSQRSCGLQRG